MNLSSRKLLCSVSILVSIASYTLPTTSGYTQEFILNTSSGTGRTSFQNDAAGSRDIQDPLSLKACLKQAIAGNPLIAEANLGIAAGERLVESATGKHYPKLSFDANYAKRLDPMPYIPAQSPTLGPHFSDEFASWQVLMTLPIYQGGQIINGVKLAKVRKIIQDDNLALTRNEIMVNVVNTYNKILQLQKLRDASQASVAALENQTKNTQLLFHLGRVAKVDLLKVTVQLANEKQRRLYLDEAIQTSLETLRYLMGKQAPGAAASIALSDALMIADFEPDTAGAWETAKKKRPEYLLAEKGVEEAKTIHQISTGKLFPAMSFIAGFLDQYGFNPAYDEANWFTGVNLSISLFEKSLYADIDRERIQEKKAEKHLLAISNQIKLDIQVALSSMKESKNRVLTAEQVIEQAEESFRIEEVKYNSGAGAVVDMLFAQAAYVTSVANHSQALFDYNSAVAAYRKATGTLEEYLQ